MRSRSGGRSSISSTTSSTPSGRRPAPQLHASLDRQHYSEFIDVAAWIDHHCLNVLAKNVDGLRYSAYFHKERGGRLVAGPLWDFDRSFGTPYDPRAAEPEEWRRTWSDATDYFNEGWWGLLFRDPDFRSRYRERFKALLSRDFSADNIDLIVDGMVAEIGRAADRNFERWTQTPPRDNAYAAEIALLKIHAPPGGWLKTQRTPISECPFRTRARYGNASRNGTRIRRR